MSISPADRADEIAGEALCQAFAAMHEATGWCGDMEDENYAAAGPVIAAALRSYGKECCNRGLESMDTDDLLEIVAGRLEDHDAYSAKIVRAFKTGPSTQDWP